jgi:hypothetical protein
VSEPRHICNERETREKLNLVGKDVDLPRDRGVGWCGEDYVGWMFKDAEHALLHLKYNGGIAPCRACLLALRAVIDEELGDVET